MKSAVPARAADGRAKKRACSVAPFATHHITGPVWTRRRIVDRRDRGGVGTASKTTCGKQRNRRKLRLLKLSRRNIQKLEETIGMKGNLYTECFVRHFQCLLCLIIRSSPGHGLTETFFFPLYRGHNYIMVCT